MLRTGSLALFDPRKCTAASAPLKIVVCVLLVQSLPTTSRNLDDLLFLPAETPLGY
jgi:hypothetical protein